MTASMPDGRWPMDDGFSPPLFQVETVHVKQPVDQPTPSRREAALINVVNMQVAPGEKGETNRASQVDPVYNKTLHDCPRVCVCFPSSSIRLQLEAETAPEFDKQQGLRYIMGLAGSRYIRQNGGKIIVDI